MVGDIEPFLESVTLEADVAHTGDREPSNVRRERDDQQVAGPKDRHRIADERENRNAVADRALRSAGGEDADEHTDHDREQKGGRDEQDRRPDAVTDERGDRLIEAVRGTEVA